MGKGPDQTFFQRRHTNGLYEKMLNITNHQTNENQNHNEILPHTCQDGYYEKEKRKTKR